MGIPFEERKKNKHIERKKKKERKRNIERKSKHVERKKEPTYRKKSKPGLLSWLAYWLGTGKITGSNPGKGDNFSLKISN